MQNRRHFLKQAGIALTAAGIYEQIDRIASPPVRSVFAASSPTLATFLPEQYLLPNPLIIQDDGSGMSTSTGQITVTVPPLHHQVVTAKLNIRATPDALQDAQFLLEHTIQRLEKRYAPNHAGLGITIAWGIPYFTQYIPSLQKSSSHFLAGTRYPDYLPIDLHASTRSHKKVHALLEAIAFPSDQPPAPATSIRLEQNDVVIILRSDFLAHIVDGAQTIFGHGSNQAGDLFSVTSIRRGFAGGGFYGEQSLPSRMAQAAGIPGAQHIPHTAELFLGFTSTVQASLASGNIANLESLPGLTDQMPDGYFQHGTTMHLSHVYEDLVAWYEGNRHGNFSVYSDRVRSLFHPGLSVSKGTQTIAQGPLQAENEVAVVSDAHTHGLIGHGASLQPITRLAEATTDNHGTVYPAGTTMIQRSDFTSLDNPFAYSSDPDFDHYSERPAAGVHFIFFAPTSDIIHRMRLAMDGHYPSGTTIPFHPRSAGMGINSILFTSHRQNFLVPSRLHRAFPLAEFLR